MGSLTTDKNVSIVVSALRARANFGKLLRRVADERRSVVIEKRGTPKAVLLSIRDYVNLAAPEPEALRLIGEESKGKGTSSLTARQHVGNLRQHRRIERSRPRTTSRCPSEDAGKCFRREPPLLDSWQET